MTPIVLVTHPDIGQALCRQAEEIIGHSLPLRTVDIGSGTDPDLGLERLNEVFSLAAGPANAILILTDLPGATPHNLALQAAAGRSWPVVSGLNLPMLLKVLNHADKPAGELAALAHYGGRQGIVAA